MDGAMVIERIYKVIKAIYTQAQLVKANHAQCVLLAERVQIIQSAMKKIKEIPKTEAYQQGLKHLEACLIKILKYMKELSGENWFRQFINARSHAEQFA